MGLCLFQQKPSKNTIFIVQNYNKGTEKNKLIKTKSMEEETTANRRCQKIWKLEEKTGS